MALSENKFELFVSGRLCIFGEHSDWAGLHKQINSEIETGMAIVTGIEEGIYATVEKDVDFIVDDSAVNPEVEPLHCSMDRETLKRVALSNSFYAYVAGVASYIKEHYSVGGVKITINKRTLPLKKGLSSSASICVLVARAFNIAYNLQLNTVGEMRIAYHGEQRTKSRCGRLDQACAYGVRPVCMYFDGSEIEVEPLKVKEELHWVFADLMAGKDTIKILADLNKCYPFASNEKEKAVHEALGKDNRMIVEKAKELIGEGKKEELGRLLDEAQSLFDKKVAPACPEQLSSPVLHEVLCDGQIRKWIYGAKGVGSQGDGMVQFLAKDESCQKQLMEYLQKVKHMDAYSLTIKPYHAVKKAIIPVAGFGTRMYPATRAIRKEFLPVVDVDGLCKPAIMILLEELDEAGIQEICLVISKEDEPLLNQFFKDPLSETHLQKLPEYMREYEVKIQRIGQKIQYVYQQEQMGFGHAVLQAKNFAENTPVLLCLGDTIYKSYEEKNCTEQLLDAYEKTGKLTVSIHEVSLNDVIHYGVMAGEWESEQQSILNVSKFVEKPNVDYAKEYLNCAAQKNSSQYFAVFGEYIITPSVFEELELMLENFNQGQKGELQLTDALARVMNKEGMNAYRVQGESYDIGIPEAYKKTMMEFG